MRTTTGDRKEVRINIPQEQTKKIVYSEERVQELKQVLTPGRFITR